MSLAIETITEVDTSAWPSSYGRGKRVDLEKFFEKVQQEQQMIEKQQQLQQSTDEGTLPKGQGDSGAPRRVRFSSDPPTVFVYEAEYDSFDRLVSSIEQSKDTWPSYARRSPNQLDLRPIWNHQYRSPPPPCINTTFTTTANTSSPLVLSPPQQRLQPPRRSSSTSTKSSLSTLSVTLSTPPLSPTPTPPCLSSGDDSSDEETSPTVPLTPTNSLPFSPTTLTKRLTAVFSRRKRP